MIVTAFMHRFLNILSPCSMFAMSFLLFSVFSIAGAADTTVPPEGAKKISIQRGSEQIAVFTVETVTDQKKLQKGLADSPPIPDDFGMLFILDSASEQFFWMKGMKFPIDILFFDKDKKLSEILPNLLPCEECTKYKAPANTAFTLELNADMAAALGIKMGDSFVFADK